MLSGGHVLDAPGAGDTELQRGGDKTLNSAGAGAAVDGLDIDDTAFQLRELAQFTRERAVPPSSSSRLLTTMASTGRCMKLSVKAHLLLEVHGVVDGNTGVPVQLVLTDGHYPFAAEQAIENGDLPSRVAPVWTTRGCAVVSPLPCVRT